jgi:hypothetical protein
MILTYMPKSMCSYSGKTLSRYQNDFSRLEKHFQGIKMTFQDLNNTYMQQSMCSPLGTHIESTLNHNCLIACTAPPQ